MSFKGIYFHTLDSKKRVFIPAKYREALGESFVLFRAKEKCIYGYTNEDFDIVSEQFLNSKSRDVQRAFFSQVADGNVDANGRVVLSPECVEHAELLKDVVILGAGRRIEIWSLENYKAETKSLFDLVDADDYVW